MSLLLQSAQHAGLVMKGYTSLLRCREDPLIPIELTEVDLLDPGVRQEPEAEPARAGRDEGRRAVDLMSVSRGLRNGVGFGVHGTNAVPLIHHVPDFVAVREADDATVVPGRDQVLVPNQDTAHVLTGACGAGRDVERDLKEVLDPVRSPLIIRRQVC